MNTNTIFTMSDLIDEFLEGFGDISVPRKLPDVFVSSPFPPCDILKKEDNSLVYKFALAGYKMEEIELKFDNDYMILTLTPKVDEQDSKFKYKQKGIRKSRAEAKFFVPVSHFDVEKASASLTDGILLIEIPTKEIAKPKTLNIKVN